MEREYTTLPIKADEWTVLNARDETGFRLAPIKVIILPMQTTVVVEISTLAGTDEYTGEKKWEQLAFGIFKPDTGEARKFAEAFLSQYE